MRVIMKQNTNRIPIIFFSRRSGYNTPLSRATPPLPPPLPLPPAASASFSSFRPSSPSISRPTSPPPLSNTDLEILREIVTICENHLGRDVQPLAETLGIPFKVGHSSEWGT